MLIFNLSGVAVLTKMMILSVLIMPVVWSDQRIFLVTFHFKMNRTTDEVAYKVVGRNLFANFGYSVV